MKTWQKIAVGKLVILVAALFISTIVRAQTGSGVTPPSENWLTQNPMFVSNPAAAELVSNLLNAPQPDLSVPEVSHTTSTAGTFWTLKNGSAPLPFNPFPDLPVYSVGTNDQFLIDDRSVDYTTLDAQLQEESELEGLTNPPITISPINTNGLWLEVPTNSLSVSNQFKVILHNTIQGQSYDFLTTSTLANPASWATELTTTGALGSATQVALSRSARPILFVRAQVSTSYSFYINMPPISQDVFDGDSVTFSVNTGGNTNLTFQWTFDGTAISGATNSSYTIDSVQDSDAGDYAVIIGDGTYSLVTPPAQLTTESSTGDKNLIPVTSGRQNYTFKSGVTYYIGSQIYLYGNTTIEGGAILKFDWNNNSSLLVMDGLTCKTEPYNPAILTSIDDDAVGEVLGFSSGSPQTAGNGTPYLDMTYSHSNSVSNLRVCFADWGISTPLASRRLNVWDCQFVQCNYGLINLVAGTGADDSLHNVLFAACGAVVGASSNSVAIEGEQVTADVGDFCLANVTPSRIALTNSILWGNSPTASSLSTVNVASNPDDTNFVFEGNASYYLSANSSLHHSGTSGISSRLQTELQNKTTYSPVTIASFVQVSGDLTLSPQVARYTNGAPDLGYYYDALDYSVANLTLSGNINVLPGTAIAIRNDYISSGNFYTVEGFLIQQGASFLSHGTPTKPNIFTAEKMVQEFPETGFSGYQQFAGWTFGIISFVSDYELNNNNSRAPLLDFDFSKFYLPPNDYHVWAGMDEFGQFEVSPDSSMYFSLQDCQVHGGRINLGNPDFNTFDPTQVYAVGAVYWLNNSFENVNINLDPTYNEYGDGVNCDMQVQAYNNLFKGGLWLHLEPIPTSAGNWIFKDNLFDHADLVQDINEPLDYNYNGYSPLSADELAYDFNFYPWLVNNTNQLQTTTTGDGFTDGGNEVTLSSAPPYQFATFGKFYLPDTTALYGAGSRSPADAGLYQYTTRTDQTKEGDETSGHMINIGIHYVAADSFGQPKDANSDGIPDFIEDATGNGSITSDYMEATNSVYDDIDLSSDGLVGRIKAALGMNPLNATNPLMATQIITGEEPDIATFEVPISYNLITNIGNLNLYIDGSTASFQECDPATDGNCLLKWNTTYNSPGQHYLQVQLALNGQLQKGNTPDASVFTAYGKILPFFSTNVMQFDPFFSEFSDSGATLQAQLPEPDADYTIELKTLSGTHIKTITNSTSSGQINEFWDLTDDSGHTVTNESINAVFNVTLLDPGSGTSTRQLTKGTSVTDGNFTIAYAWNNGSIASGAMRDCVQFGAVDTLLTPSSPDFFNPDPYFSTFNDFTSPGDNGNPGFISSQGFANSNLLSNLADLSTRNFHFDGHGNDEAIGNGLGDKDPSVISIAAGDVGLRLQNFFNGTSPKGRKHPYRFVFLDACDTADQKFWSRAFGIMDTITSTDLANGAAPQAFVGWVNESKGPQSSDDFEDFASTYAVFYNAWVNGATLDTCIQLASSHDPFGDGTILLNFPLGQKYSWPLSWTWYKNPNTGKSLWANDFHVRVIGYSGITRTSYESGHDGSPFLK
jgi:hypothetical protein